MKDNVLLVYCKTDLKQVEKKFLEDNEEYAKIDDIKKLNERYTKFIERVALKTLTYNYLVTSPEKITNHIKVNGMV